MQQQEKNVLESFLTDLVAWIIVIAIITGMIVSGYLYYKNAIINTKNFHDFIYLLFIPTISLINLLNSLRNYKKEK
jgi:hypothetical protein